MILYDRITFVIVEHPYDSIRVKPPRAAGITENAYLCCETNYKLVKHAHKCTTICVSRTITNNVIIELTIHRAMVLMIMMMMLTTIEVYLNTYVYGVG